MPLENLAASGGSFGGIAPLIRWGVLKIGQFELLDDLIRATFSRFAQFGGDVLNRVASIIRDGVLAVQQFWDSGVLSSNIMDMIPQIPIGTFSNPASDRVIIATDIVGINEAGEVVDRRVYTIGVDEGTEVSELMTSGASRIYERIKGTDPKEAEDFAMRYLEAHWAGRIW